MTVPDAVLTAAAAVAGHSGRRIIRVRGSAATTDVLVLGWDGDTAPSAGLVSPPLWLGLSPIPTLVWAACLRAAWPEPGLAPFPGRPFVKGSIASLCSALGADRKSVEQALERTLPDAHLITAKKAVCGLGAAVAALPPAVVEGLRRGHHLLPAAQAEVPGMEQIPVPGQGSSREIPADTGPVPEASDPYVVRSAIAALETARGPVPRGALPVLADPAMRSAAEGLLRRCGRQLLQTADGNWATGFGDTVAEALVAEGTGTLGAVDRAVLALVLLHTVAIPRAQGRHRHSRWTGEQHAVTLASNRKISKVAMSAALRRLRAAGMVAESTTGHYVPGPALDRLSDERSSMVWEDLILVGRPDGHLATAIRRRRGLAASLPPDDGRPADGLAETDQA
ncbi:hypothetical protein ACFXDH_50250 [Streptomyces sp. NPDC059467]|uniref:hypothetical protein n=1 Tax=Streptomyces sp. NPDC059467 TaxID=3346844 RepID=UPI003690C0FB